MTDLPGAASDRQNARNLRLASTNAAPLAATLAADTPWTAEDWRAVVDDIGEADARRVLAVLGEYGVPSPPILALVASVLAKVGWL